MGWRNEETKAVKMALEIAGIKASVRHGIGTAGSWIEIITQGSFGKHWKAREGNGTVKKITQAEAETLSTKRRWFLLKGSTLSFHKGPRELKAIGSVSIGSLYLMKIIYYLETIL